jgi:Lipase (class 3)
MSSLSPGYSNAEAQLLMQFSALAYTDETALFGETIPQQEARMKTDIDSALRTSLPGWRVAWGPALSSDRANMLYIAGNTALNQYAVAVRGTDWSFILNWIEDFASMLPLVPYPALNAGKVAAGTLIGVQTLQGLNFLSFVGSLPQNAGAYVTGHSLGGCLASAIAPLVANQVGASGSVKVYTFAAPSPGDATFKSYFDGLFGVDSMAYRVYDTLDAVPDAWTTLATIKTYYAGFYPCPDDIKAIVDFGIRVVGNEYATVGTDHPLTGRIIWPFGAQQKPTIDPIGDAVFLWQVGQQHATVNYLSLLNATLVTSGLARIQGLAQRLGKL